jgi:multiple sugar transport system ATP-binding protein
VGPSGCGKTSLLRALGGLVPISSGTVHFDDDDVTELSPKDRLIGIVFQNYALYPHMESQRNLGFFFKMHKREQEVPERVELTCKIMGEGFEELLDRKPKTLSGGQKQRVAIARCIIRNPRVFLFDEPLSNLDAKLRSQTRIEIKRLLRQFGITAVYVTHDQTEAIALGDRIAVMQSGKIVQIGTYSEIYERPVSKFVAGFFGSPPMNLLSGIVRERRIICDDHDFEVDDDSLRILEGESVTLGIRPEHLELGNGDNSFALEVDIIQKLLSDRSQLVTFRMGDNDVVGKFDVGEKIDRGSEIRVNFRKDLVRVFDSHDIRVL